MLDYKDILTKHYVLHLSAREISKQSNASKSGVNDFLKAFRECEDLDYPRTARIVFPQIPRNKGRRNQRKPAFRHDAAGRPAFTGGPRVHRAVQQPVEDRFPQQLALRFDSRRPRPPEEPALGHSEPHRFTPVRASAYCLSCRRMSSGSASIREVTPPSARSVSPSRPRRL